MEYKSTRSDIFSDSLHAVLSGIAPDGGLFVCPDIDKIKLDIPKILTMDTQSMAVEILGALLPEYSNMSELVKQAYSGKFETEDLTPLVKVGSSYILELFRGPTCAFKDVALSMLPVLISAARKQLGSKEETVILTATSGDTGKAALEGFKDVEGTKIIVFYPYGGVSAVQKAQMATQEGKNVFVCAVKGNFDDCQTAVKKAFISLNKTLQNSAYRLSSANSINIGRLAPQVVYYFASYRDLVKEGAIKYQDKVNFIVPTGNFGDILAGFYAKLLGLPVGKLVCAANMNNVLTTFIRTGVYDKNRPFYKTASPSMDILVSSNLERLLYYASNKNSELVSSWMNSLNTNGKFEVDSSTLAYIQQSFDSYFCLEDETSFEIKDCWEKHHYLLDTHTACAWHALRRYKEQKDDKNVCVVLSTASPYKFPVAVLGAIDKASSLDEFEQMESINRLTGVKIPSNLANLRSAKERFKDVIDASDIASYVMSCLKG